MNESETHNTIDIFSYTILLGTILSYYFIVLISPHLGMSSIICCDGGGGGYGHQGQHLYFFPQPVITQSVKFSFTFISSHYPVFNCIHFFLSFSVLCLLPDEEL